MSLTVIIPEDRKLRYFLLKINIVTSMFCMYNWQLVSGNLKNITEH